MERSLISSSNPYELSSYPACSIDSNNKYQLPSNTSYCVFKNINFLCLGIGIHHLIGPSILNIPQLGHSETAFPQFPFSMPSQDHPVHIIINKCIML